MMLAKRSGVVRLLGSTQLLLAAFVACGGEREVPRSGPSAAGSAGLGGAATSMAGHSPGGSSSSGGLAQAGNETGGASSAGVAGKANVAGSDSPAGAAGMVSSCPSTSAALLPWPGKDEVKTLDTPGQFTSDVSGLTYEPAGTNGPGALWAVNNLSSTLFRLVPSGEGYVPDTANGWGSGKALRYPNGEGGPDSEGVTFGESLADGVYVAAEHDSRDAATSRSSVLRYDVSAAGATLTATHEWNLTALLPKLGANTGIEGISWVPDSYLTKQGFLDETKGHAYAPADYPDHGAGLFFVGVEQSGKLYGFALNHGDGSVALLATISTPGVGVMGLEFDRDNGDLWFNCDEGCENESGILRVDTRADSSSRGKFVLYRLFQRPSSLPNSNNEGIAIAPNAECNGGFKYFFWTDDADDAGFSLRADLIPCNVCY